MVSNKKKISRQRLEELVWLQCAQIEALTETIKLLRKQNELLHSSNQKLKEETGRLPKVRSYQNTYAKKAIQKKDKKDCISIIEE